MATGSRSTPQVWIVGIRRTNSLPILSLRRFVSDNHKIKVGRTPMRDRQADDRDRKKRKGKMVVHGARFRELVRNLSEKLRRNKEGK